VGDSSYPQALLGVYPDLGQRQGGVNEEQFARLAEGQHPHTGEQLVRHQAPREYVNDAGETVKAMEHGAGPAKGRVQPLKQWTLSGSGLDANL
jgi:hypothetical protein